MPITANPRALSRRSLLRGAGVALALPLLDAMKPALGRALPQQTAPKRLISICATLGFHQPFFTPETAGRSYAATPYLAELGNFREQFTIFSGLSHAEQNGNNGHASEMTWLTAARHPGLAGFRNTISLDQLIAEQVGRHTRFPFLALSSGPASSLSWTAGGVEIPPQVSPSSLFNQLFVAGTPAERATQAAQFKRGRSILDTVLGEAHKLHHSLGVSDQQKLDEYLASVRDLETQLQVSAGWLDQPKPPVNTKPPVDVFDKTDFVSRTRLMNELMVLALQTDSTRTITFRLAGMNQVPKVAGVSQDWHQLSHHGQDGAKIEELKLIELAKMRELADLLGRLKSIDEQGQTLLDRTAVLYGSNLGNASAHDWHNLPILVAGGGFRHGQHLAFDRQNNTPLCNLFVTLARHMGLEIDKFAGSTAAGVTDFELV